MYTLMRSQQEGTDGATDSHEGDGVDLLAGLTRYVQHAAPSEADLSVDFALSAAARGDAAVSNTVSPAEYLEALVGGGGERVEVVSAAAAGSVRASVRPQSGRAGRREEGGRWACARGRAEGELGYGGGAMGERAGAEEAEVVWGSRQRVARLRRPARPAQGAAFDGDGCAATSYVGEIAA